MGVHDQTATQKAKELLGIPADEPVFILRAQDILYPAVLAAYAQLYRSASAVTRRILDGENYCGPSAAEVMFMDHVAAVEDNGRRWQRKNSVKVKLPDMH